MPGWLEALGWGLLTGGALVVGAGLGYQLRVPRRLVASAMAFGAGTLLAAMAYELIADAHERAGLLPTAVGAVTGALAYTGVNLLLARRGGRHRKRSGGQQPSEQQQAGSGLAIAVGSLLDGVPESVVIGGSVLAGGPVSTAAVAAIMISNVPEGLSSATGMRRAGRPARYVYGVWGAVAMASGAAVLIGYLLLGRAPEPVLAGITALAAGAILTMVSDTMIPEAFDQAHLLIGLVTVAGFLTAFGLSQLAG